MNFCRHNTLDPQCSFVLRLFLVSKASGTLPNITLGPFTPSPIEQLTTQESEYSLNTGNVLLIEPASNIPLVTHDLHTTRGPFPMYIG
ncbi:hypothetical protein SMA63_23885, partial [Escherichia coli]|uniref:hypothetical protein n=1 Tax=Escherichia coli TaxID=562 RepID=UPI0030794902